MTMIIWDFNGTIIDDVAYCHRIETDMLKERNMKTFTLEEYREMFCFPVIDYYYKMGYTFENESYDDVSQEFNDAYDRDFSSLHLMEGFLEAIQRSLSHGHTNIILSASRQDKLEEQCRVLGIDGYFTRLLGTDNLYGGSKVNIAKDYFAKENVNPAECMFIGDSLHDQETAHAVGITDVVLIDRGHQARDVLEKECGHVVDSFEEIAL